MFSDCTKAHSPIWKSVYAAGQLLPLVFPFNRANDSMIAMTLTVFPDNILDQLIQENSLIESVVDMTQTKETKHPWCIWRPSIGAPLVHTSGLFSCHSFCSSINSASNFGHNPVFTPYLERVLSYYRSSLYLLPSTQPSNIPYLSLF